MAEGQAADGTAVRVALWRAMHVQVDAPPHVLEDEVGLRLADPDAGWRDRPDMHPAGTSRFRAAIVARARFIEDLVVAQAGRGVTQYVILGAGLDTFAQRRAEVAGRLLVFEVDQPGPQAWKRQRLIELGFGVPAWLRLVPVDFEAGGSWWEQLATAGFDAGQPAVVVSMYLSKDANLATLRQIAGRDAVHQLLHPGRNAGAGPRSGLQGRPARGGNLARRALLRRPDRRPSPVDRRGSAGSHHLSCSPVYASAKRAISTRERRPVFCRTCETWLCTVLGETNSRVPISRLVSPSRTSAAILTSVAVRLAQP
jgi:methyltransferase (TIGR00027 family)